MEQYFALIVLVLPGFIARRVEESVHFKGKTTPFEETMWSLAYSIPIVFFSVLIMNIFGDFDSPKKVSSFYGLAVYTPLSFVLAALFGAFLSAKIQKKFTAYINCLRKRNGRSAINSGGLPWEKLFCDDKKHLVAVHTDKGEVIYGYTDCFSGSNNRKRELTLAVPEWLDDDFIKKLGTDYPVKTHYFSFDDKTVITEYEFGNEEDGDEGVK